MLGDASRQVTRRPGQRRGRHNEGRGDDGSRRRGRSARRPDPRTMQGLPISALPVVEVLDPNKGATQCHRAPSSSSTSSTRPSPFSSRSSSAADQLSEVASGCSSQAPAQCVTSRSTSGTSGSSRSSASPMARPAKREEVAEALGSLADETAQKAGCEESEAYEAHAVLLNLKRKQQDSADADDQDRARSQGDRLARRGDEDEEGDQGQRRCACQEPCRLRRRHRRSSVGNRPRMASPLRGAGCRRSTELAGRENGAADAPLSRGSRRSPLFGSAARPKADNETAPTEELPRPVPVLDPVESPALDPALTPAPGTLPLPGRVVGRVSSRVLSPVSGPVTVRAAPPLAPQSPYGGCVPRDQPICPRIRMLVDGSSTTRPHAPETQLT